MVFNKSMTVNMDVPLEQGDIQRYFLLCYFLLVVIISFLGNSFILSASCRKGVLKTDKTTVAFLQFLAILDILIGLFHGVPVLVTLGTERWSLGWVVCLLNACVSRVLYITEILLTVAISCYRLWMLKQPRAVRDRIRVFYVRLFLLLLVLISCGLVGIQLKSDGRVEFEPSLMSCSLTRVTGHPGT